ncbi:hypothetical protein PR202_gb02398 [Eleusine coracana subsp. coracana]|uniref:S-acyltransferase n=1 Tax=Eleusine coracana subsp. coracana TaxID=191504 RepID=A0AAV5DWV8_ELECO|nr:hypothetical protein PR202_gb02398 [Eleusine coracana subsp. coracana]
MVRKHGWQLPAHTLQIVAITVFFLLVVAFYAFFAPFLGKQVLEYVAIGIYTPVAFAVFILYIRCTSINPADPGIVSKFEDGFTDAPARTADLDGTSLPEKLAIEFGIGIAVIVICFTNKNSETIIKDKLGNGLTRPSLCRNCSELFFFFHMILIRKGITTYEYVVAMRAMSEVPQEDEDEEGVNIVYSPTNSATTAFSGASSLGIHNKGPWCTPPRIFVDQDEVIPHLEPGMVPSSVDPDAAGHAERANKAKKPVKISPWKLAKLDSNEAMKAAAKARASSSVLRPIDAARRGPYADLSSSGNGSMRSSMSIDHSASKEKKIDKKLSSSQSSYPQTHSVASRDDYESGTPSASSVSSPVHIHKPAAPHIQINVPPRPPPQPPRAAPVMQRPPVPAMQINKPVFESATSYIRENRKASVVWDQEAGRYVSVASAPTRPGSVGVDLAARAPHFLANSGGEPSNRTGTGTTAPVAASSSALPSERPSERLTYTGQSIFFGGPLLGAAAAAAADSRRNEAGTRTRPEERRRTDTGGERRRTAESFPVFAPGIIQKNPPFNR